jgi:hypothetical protein
MKMGDAGVRCAVVAVLCAAVGGWIGLGSVARAEGCSAATENVRQKQAQVRSPLAAALPDCRVYEQVSPVDKNTVDASGEANKVEASPPGAGVTFFAVAPFPQSAGSGQLPTYLSARLPGDEWSTLVSTGSVESVVGLTGDLSRAIVKVTSLQATTCEPTVVVCGGFGEGNIYIRDDATGAFQFIATAGPNEVGFADATPGGSPILFETKAKLTSEAEPGVNNLYEWNEAKPPTKRISLAGVLPGGVVPKQGAYAGPGGGATFREAPLGNKWHYYTQHTISDDGSRIFFSDAETGDIYMREPQAEPAVTIPISKGEAFWRAATPDGSYVFYSEGEDLFRFNVDRFTNSEEPEATALAEAREQLTTKAEGVLGVLGISERDASYVYFVALGKLADNENANGETALPGTHNVYEWHEGVVTFIARPEVEANWRGWTDQTNEPQGPAGGQQAARVSFDGRYLLFDSIAKLSSYNNNGFSELYLYDAGQPFSSHNPTCVSCNPAQSPATANVHLTDANVNLVAVPISRNAFLTHNLSSDGHRVFFETTESLLPGDANLQDDVYQWEANGEGSCEGEVQNGGCLYLISTGQSTQRSYFGDASANGDDVFFFTRQSLVSQDQDNNVDLYDANVEGGIPGQNTSSGAKGCGGEATCRGKSSNTLLVFGAPSSTTFSEPDNLMPLPPSPPSHVETRAEKLSKALRACRSKSRSRRERCKLTAQKRYGTPKGKAKRTAKRGGRR